MARESGGDRLDRFAASLVEHVVRTGGGFSLVEAESFLASEGLEVSGDREMFLERMNATLWQGVSEEFTEVIRRAVDTQRIHWYPTTPLVYAIDGRMLALPVIGGRPPKGGYRERRWLPVVFNVGPDPTLPGGRLHDPRRS